MNKNTQKKTDGCKAVKQMQGEPLTLTITIPASAAPLFRAFAELRMVSHPRMRVSKSDGADAHYGFIPNEPMTMERIAVRGLIEWLTSEKNMDLFDGVVNSLLDDV